MYKKFRTQTCTGIANYNVLKKSVSLLRYLSLGNINSHVKVIFSLK